jgi:hypothetical protein
LTSRRFEEAGPPVERLKRDLNEPPTAGVEPIDCAAHPGQRRRLREFDQEGADLEPLVDQDVDQPVLRALDAELQEVDAVVAELSAQLGEALDRKLESALDLVYVGGRTGNETLDRVVVEDQRGIL